MSCVLALESDSWLRARLRAGVRAGPAHGLVECVHYACGWRDLRRLVLRFPGSPAFVDPSHPSRDGRQDVAVSLQREAPACPLISYGKAGPAGAALRFVKVLMPKVDDRLVAIGTAVVTTADYELVLALTAELRRGVRVEARTLLERVVRDTVFPCTVAALATSLGTSVRMLERRCKRWRLPGPKKLLSLARVFHVLRLSKWSGRPPGAVALALGYSAYSNYARSVRRELGCTSSAVVGRGGAAYVAERLVDSTRGSF